MPILKLKNNVPLGWFTEVGSEWKCQECAAVQKPNTVAAELQTISKKSYVCLNCASKIFENLHLHANLLNQKGIKIYEVMKKL